MSGSDKKKTGVPTPPSGGAFYRIAEIYDRAWADTQGDDTIDLTWHAGRSPGVFEPPPVLSPDLRPHWPVRTPPSHSLRPLGGHATPSSGSVKGALFVTLFGIAEDRVTEAVARIERQIRPAQSMRPVFLTDQRDTSVFRRAGFTFETFPNDIFGDVAQATRFARRFEDLWRKWNGAMLIDFSVPGYLAERIENLDTYIGREVTVENPFDPRLPKKQPRQTPVTDVVALKADYRAAGLDTVPDTFVLTRVLGNDLPPRHEVGQTLANLRFMLDHEPPLADCEKRWVVNRIVDAEQEAAIIGLLEERGQSYLRIPFDLEEYGRVGWDLDRFPDPAFFLRGRYTQMTPYAQARAQAHLRRHKNNYVINNNGARNAALRDGRARAKWVLPWDGNCFVTQKAWDAIVSAVRARPYLKYFTVPMVRATDNAQLLDPDYDPVPDSEPQILFRTDSPEEFNEAHFYGRRPKVELFYRLGIPGPWDRFNDDVWDLSRPKLSDDAGSVGEAGWVARLFSGQGALETEDKSTIRARGEARIEAITGMLDRLDVKALEQRYTPETLTCYDMDALSRLAVAQDGTPDGHLRARLTHEADLALQRGPYSVTQKSEVAPSGDVHDYYHPAPYWWPNPLTPDGYPFVFRDGERVPGTRLFEPQSDRYDRTRLQLMFDDTTLLALAWQVTGRDDYARHAALLIRTWFIDPETRMTPHLTHAQGRGRWPGDTGAKSGLIEMKDLYYLLDAIRLVEASGMLSDTEQAELRRWLRSYLEWLQTSEQGVDERLTKNNHGTCYDLQTGAIAAFLGDAALLERILLTSRERLLEQFTKGGRQPHEMKRTQTQHYCAFNLHGWISLATLADACGHDLWSFEGADGRGLARACHWFLKHMDRDRWPYEQIEPFARARFLPLYFAARDVAVGPHGMRSVARMAAMCDPLFFPHDGIKPFWMLGRKPRHPASTETWRETARTLANLSHTVTGWLNAPDESDTALTHDVLDAQLWGGFSETAVAGLRTMASSPTAEPDEKRAAAWSLARWAFSQGDAKTALTHLQDAVFRTQAERRAHAILHAACLAATGNVTAAERLVRDHLDRSPNDPDFCLLMANLSRGRAAGEATWTAWVNRIYRQGGLEGLLGTADGTVGWHAPGTAQAGLNEDDPLVSIILAPRPGGTPLDTTLAAARAQSWGKLELLVVDRSGDTDVGRALAEQAKADPRIVAISLAPDTPDHEAWRQALDRATGSYITRAGPEESAHPMKIELQLEALRTQGVRAVISRTVRMTPEGEALVTLAPSGPGLLQDDPASLMVEAELMRDAGGWDAVDAGADDLLIWRLGQDAALSDIPVACPDLPLSLTLATPDAASNGPALRKGAVKRNARALIRHGMSIDGAEPHVIPPALPDISPRRAGRFETVFVGDLSASTPGFEHVLRHIEAATDATASVGVFHWPDDATDWASHPADPLLALVTAGRVAWVQPFDTVRAERVILCQPHLIAHMIDGLPAFQPKRVEVLAGPQLRAPVATSLVAPSLPDTRQIESVFSAPVVWVSV